MSSYRAANRSRRIQTNHNRSQQLQYVSTSDLGCIMLCIYVIDSSLLAEFERSSDLDAIREGVADMREGVPKGRYLFKLALRNQLVFPFCFLWTIKI